MQVHGLNEDGTLKPVSAWPEAVKKAAISVKVRTNADGAQITEVKLVDKTKPLALLAQHLGLTGTKRDQGEEISALLARVLLEMHERLDAPPKDVTPAVDWAPLSPQPINGQRHPLPPSPDEA